MEFCCYGICRAICKGCLAAILGHSREWALQIALYPRCCEVMLEVFMAANVTADTPSYGAGLFGWPRLYRSTRIHGLPNRFARHETIRVIRRQSVAVDLCFWLSFGIGKID